MIYSRYIKKILDVVFGVFFAIMLLPMLTIVWLILLSTQGRSVFFIQKRTGKNQEAFNLVKFRTLKPTDSTDLSMTNREITRCGNFLRKSGIDELPQLINIIKGEMSFIGPRAMPIEYIGKYHEKHLKRFIVNPGITGWAQVHGKNNITWGKRFELDCWYVENMSFSIDFKIIFLTISQIFRAIFNDNRTTKEMPVFNGSNLN